MYSYFISLKIYKILTGEFNFVLLFFSIIFNFLEWYTSDGDAKYEWNGKWIYSSIFRFYYWNILRNGIQSSSPCFVCKLPIGRGMPLNFKKENRNQFPWRRTLFFIFSFVEMHNYRSRTHLFINTLMFLRYQNLDVLKWYVLDL